LNIDDFYADVRNTVRTRAVVDNDFKSASFMAEVGERLTEAEEIENLSVLQFEGSGVRNRRLAVNGYDLDDGDGSVALAVLLFHDSDEIATLSMAEAKRALSALENFLGEAVTGSFSRDREESSPAYGLAEDLKRRGRSVTRYRLYLITDARMSDRTKAIPSSEVNGVRVDFHIWDIQRLHQVHESQQGREELEIDLTEWLPDGLRALRISSESPDFTTYLAAVPGAVVADLYGRFGSRLLEGNVRSFLSARGKVNKGIKTTVLSEPDMFLAYNNGITATATGVDVSPDGSTLRSIRDLQIVNGGQTTASLFYISRDNVNQSNFDHVVVQMKLVVVTPERALELVPKISRYANSQNRVSDADFFSNSPFHVRMEELSRRVLAPAKPGVNFQTKWFYERTRGQYLNEKGKLSTSEARKFQITYPRAQLITKTDAAKYEVSWAMKPHVVSSGAQKNFAFFATDVATKWEKSDSQFNEAYFRDLVSKAILFNQIRTLVAHADWYQSGYLANIVTYTLSKLAFEIARQGNGDGLNFSHIWSAQELSQDVIDTCMNIAVLAFGVLTDPGRRIANVTEWAKSEECWHALESVPFLITDGFKSCLVPHETQSDNRRVAMAVQKIDDGIAAQARVIGFGKPYWGLVQSFCEERRLLSPTDSGVLDVASGRKQGLPSERQSARLLDILIRAEQHGFQDS
jgi:hypothetical protein